MFTERHERCDIVLKDRSFMGRREKKTGKQCHGNASTSCAILQNPQGRETTVEGLVGSSNAGWPGA